MGQASQFFIEQAPGGGFAVRGVSPMYGVATSVLKAGDFWDCVRFVAQQFGTGERELGAAVAAQTRAPDGVTLPVDRARSGMAPANLWPASAMNEGRPV